MHPVASLLLTQQHSKLHKLVESPMGVSDVETCHLCQLPLRARQDAGIPLDKGGNGKKDGEGRRGTSSCSHLMEERRHLLNVSRQHCISPKWRRSGTYPFLVMWRHGGCSASGVCKLPTPCLPHANTL